jgi:hypothetical protein
MYRRLILVFAAMLLTASVTDASPAAEAIRVGRFDVDATPPVGSPLAYDPMKEATMPLSCRGVVILGDQQPIVLCSIDWIGISNDGHRVFRQRLAEAAGTTPQRVAVHAVHQHDAPRLDFSAEAILAEMGQSGTMFNVVHARTVIDNAADAVARAVKQAEPVTHIGLGEASSRKWLRTAASKAPTAKFCGRGTRPGPARSATARRPSD